MMQRIRKYFIFTSATLLLTLVFVFIVPHSEGGALAYDSRAALDDYQGARTKGLPLLAFKSSAERPSERPIDEGVIKSQDIEGEDLDGPPSVPSLDTATPEPAALPEKSGPEAAEVKKIEPAEKSPAPPVPAEAAPSVDEALKGAPLNMPVVKKPPVPDVEPEAADVKKVAPAEKQPAAMPVPVKAQKTAPLEKPIALKPAKEKSEPSPEIIAKPTSAPALKPTVKEGKAKTSPKAGPEVATPPAAVTDKALGEGGAEKPSEDKKEKAGKGGYDGPIEIRVKRLYGFDATLSGTLLGWVDQIYIDNLNDEVYLLDKRNKRIVVTNIVGGYLFHFNYSLAGIINPVAFTVDTLSGEIYLSDSKRIAILNYRGEYQEDFDLSQMPGSKIVSIQSLRLVKGKDGDLLYVGDNKNRRIMVFTTGGKYVRTIARGSWVGNNVKGLYVNKDTVFWLDSTGFSVKSIRIDGKDKRSFGRLSSLLGGFSMPVNMAIDDVNKRIIIVDANRMMVIFFDYNGNTLFEFGGPFLFSWPRAVAVDKKGRVFVSDNKGEIMVFNVIPLAPSVK